MSRYLIALAFIGAMSAPAAAQNQPTPQSAPAPAPNAPAKPQLVKKVVCEDSDMPGSHIGRVCKTIMVAAKPSASGGANSQVPAPAPSQPH